MVIFCIFYIPYCPNFYTSSFPHSLASWLPQAPKTMNHLDFQPVFLSSFCCRIGAFPHLLKVSNTCLHVSIHFLSPLPSLPPTFLYFSKKYFKKGNIFTLLNEWRKQKLGDILLYSAEFFNWALEHFLLLLATTIHDLLHDCTTFHYIDIILLLQAYYFQQLSTNIKITIYQSFRIVFFS